jgi:hypothetical protein
MEHIKSVINICTVVTQNNVTVQLLQRFIEQSSPWLFVLLAHFPALVRTCLCEVDPDILESCSRLLAFPQREKIAYLGLQSSRFAVLRLQSSTS